MLVNDKKGKVNLLKNRNSPRERENREKEIQSKENLYNDSLDGARTSKRYRATYLPKVKSTFLVNDFLERKVDGLEAGDILITDRQTSGIGNNGKWTYQEGNLTATIVLESPENQIEHDTLKLAIGMAVLRAINELLPDGEKGADQEISCGYKYPNDIRVSFGKTEEVGKKLSGITILNNFEQKALNTVRDAYREDTSLFDVDFNKFTLCGIRVNIPEIFAGEQISVTDFQGKVSEESRREVETSINTLLGEEVKIEDLLVEIAESIDFYMLLIQNNKEMFFDAASNSQITDEYRSVFFSQKDSLDLYQDKFIGFDERGAFFESKGHISYPDLSRIIAKPLISA